MAHANILDIEQEDYEYLQSLCRCRTIQAQIVDRAKILIYKAQGESNAAIAQRIDVNVNTVKLCLKSLKKAVLILLYMIDHVLVIRLKLQMMLWHGSWIWPANVQLILAIPRNFGL